MHTHLGYDILMGVVLLLELLLPLHLVRLIFRGVLAARHAEILITPRGSWGAFRHASARQLKIWGPLWILLPALYLLVQVATRKYQYEELARLDFAESAVVVGWVAGVWWMVLAAALIWAPRRKSFWGFLCASVATAAGIYAVIFLAGLGLFPRVLRVYHFEFRAPYIFISKNLNMLPVTLVPIIAGLFLGVILWVRRQGDRWFRLPEP